MKLGGVRPGVGCPRNHIPMARGLPTREGTTRGLQPVHHRRPELMGGGHCPHPSWPRLAEMGVEPASLRRRFPLCLMHYGVHYGDLGCIIFILGETI